MKIKKLLLATTATLLFATPALTIGNSSANASKWKAGTPYVFKHTKSWLSDFKKVNANGRNSKNYYIRTYTPFSAKYGFNPTMYSYDKNKKFTTSGADASATAAVNPHYKSLGHNEYLVTSGGDGSGKKSLYYELHHSLNHDFGSTVLVKVHNKKSVSIWEYDNGSKKYYFGLFKPFNGDPTK
ncbi:hypothetical protein [Nicoliella lavandulae]|uniref:Uncharacterized protein n=1 Tax=Nicoliella lavandulae TaxID=3082954 RepID=A0ABU8SNF9_9LACO